MVSRFSPAAMVAVALLAGCAADADGVEETVVYVSAGPAFADATFRLGGVEPASDRESTMWVLRPAIVDDVPRLEIELDGVGDTSELGVERTGPCLGGSTPVERIDVSVLRWIDDGSCRVAALTIDVGSCVVSGSFAPGTVDNEPCGVFAAP